MLHEESAEDHGLEKDLPLANELSPSAWILIVADDAVFRDAVTDYLKGYNMQVVPGFGRHDFARRFAERDPDLVILDLKSGQESQFDLLSEIRVCSDVPVIITADPQGDEADRVIGLKLGADDYVTKPFCLRELRVRIRAVLRRAAVCTVSLPILEPSRYRFAGWQLNRRTRELTDPGGALVPLTKGEYALLIAFLEAPQRPLSRGYLMQAIRMHEDIFDRSVDVRILRLRRKLEADPGAPCIIRTERSIGYIFSPRVELFQPVRS